MKSTVVSTGDAVRRRPWVAATVLLLVFLLCADHWFPGGGTRDVVAVRSRTGGHLVAREAAGWVEQSLLLPLLRVFEGGDWRMSTTHGSGRRPGATAGENLHGGPLAANLSVCHPSFTDSHRPVSCCPSSRRDAEQTVVDFELPDVASSPPRVRRPAHLVDPEYLAKYEKAVATMKSLPSDHPHSFRRQAQNHCLYCTGSYDQVNSTALFKIHRSWLFFPWHRAFLYFHERILGKLIGDDSFALPYWNWDVPEGMAIPEFYTRPGAFNDKQREETHLPPRVADLNYKRSVDSGLDEEEQVAANLALMYHQMVSGATKPELFMGCKLTAGAAGACDGPGTIESAPHNTVHSWVGRSRNPEWENMGAFYSAASDPVFYAHHANTDRLWTVWRKLRGRPQQRRPEFTDPEYLDTSFNFYDESLRFVRVRVRDFLDHAKLGYTYEEAALPWLDARPKPDVPPEVARGILKKRDESSSLLMRTSGELGRRRSLNTTVTTKVQRPKKRTGTQQLQGKEEEEEQEEEEVLVVYGIQVKGDRFAKLDVFVNLVGDDEQAAGPRSREFAGTFVNVPRGARRLEQGREGAASAAKVTLKLGISELLVDLGADGDESVWVSLVPRGGTGVDITVDGVRIEHLK